MPTAFRLISNRDESRSRPAALPPEIRAFGERSAILPIDSKSGGTWIGVNDAGVALTLLNVNPPVAGRMDLGSSSVESLQSRGSIIPRLLAHTSAEGAGEATLRVDPTIYPPFRLVIADDREILEVFSDGLALRHSQTVPAGTKMMFTSSGLGDHLVEEPRRKLFMEMFNAARPEAWLDTQSDFHRHVWPDRTHLSVCMSRADAWTVSMTTVEVRADRVSLSYRPGMPNAPAESVTLELNRRPI